MDLKKKNILVVGAGAIGGTIAGLLARAGYCIDLVCKHEDLAAHIRKHGLSVLRTEGHFQIVIPSYARVRDLDKKYDYVLVAVKALDLTDTAKDILPVLHENSRVVSLQNGICEEDLAEIVGKDRTVGCIVGYGATMVEPGVVEMTSKGKFVIGYLDGKQDGPLFELQELLGNVVPADVTLRMMGHLYSKMIINSCVTTLGAVSGQLLGDMLKNRRARSIFIGIIREAIAVADAMDLEVKPYGGKLDYYKFLKGPEWKRHGFIKLFGMKYRHLKSSSLQSLQRGKKTEIDYFNGYIAMKGTALDVDTPLNRYLTDLVKSIENGTREISPANFNDSFFLQYLGGSE